MTRNRSLIHRRVGQITLRLRLGGRVDQAGGHPERLVDRDLGHAVDLDRGDGQPPRDPLHAAPVRRFAEEPADRAALVGDHERALRQLIPLLGQLLPGRGVADAEAPDLLPVEDAQRDPGLDDRDVERVVGQPAALEGAVVEPLQRELLDRGAGLVRVEADLAEEDPVGPGDRAFPEADRVRAVEAVGELSQAAADALRAWAGTAVDRDRGDAETGELGGEMGGDPALVRPQLRLPPSAAAVARSRSATLAPSWAAVRSPMLALCRVPPG